MVFSEVLQRFIDQAPACVMVRATLEQVFAPDKMEAVLQSAATEQYTRDLLFGTMVDLMSMVVCRTVPTVHASYVKRRQEIVVSVQALYQKLRRVEPAVSRAVTQHTAKEVTTLIRHLKGQRRPMLAGYRCRILDGNHLGASEHRLGVLRDVGAGPLPGFVLAVLDPDNALIDDVFPCEDGHMQECRLLDEVLATVKPRDVWISDRHFCTSQFLFGLARRRAFFAIRQHAGHLVWRRCGRCRFVGLTDTGRVYEQAVILTDPESGEERTVRRITVKLAKATRDGDHEIHVLSNLPRSVSAVKIAELYRRRWTLETAFHDLTMHLKCELNTLGYPPAALFAFCVAAACYNILAAAKASLRAAHGEDTVEKTVSNFFLTEEISSTYRGMLIAVPPAEWTVFQTMTPPRLAKILYGWARRAQLSAYPKHARGPKKPSRRRPSRRHVSTQRLLEAANGSKN